MSMDFDLAVLKAPHDPNDYVDMVQLISRASEMADYVESEKVAHDKLYQAVRKCVLNRYPYEDESGIIKIQLGNFAELLKAYEEIKTKLDNSNQKV